jgi:hypothetical protein
VRMTRVETLHIALLEASAHTATLGGCVFAPRGERLRVWREYGRIDPARQPLPESGTLLWDGRFAIAAPGESGLMASALGPDGAAQLRAAGGRIKLPARIAHSLPALWCGSRLVFAPFAVFAKAPPADWKPGASAVFVGAERARANQNDGFPD